jgi:hypothetical protein
MEVHYTINKISLYHYYHHRRRLWSLPLVTLLWCASLKWVMTPCSDVVGSQRFGGPRCMVPVLFNLAPHHEGLLGEWKYTPRILHLGTRWRWVVSFTPGRFTPRERAAGTHWIGSWVGPRTGLDTVMKRKIHIPCRDSNLRSSSP